MSGRPRSCARPPIGVRRVVLGLVALLSCPVVAASQSKERLPFLHEKHVPAEWKERKGGEFVNAEVARDCRGCHAFDAAVGRDQASQCTSCHVGGNFEPNRSANHLESFAPVHPDLLFDHRVHTALACRQCHAPVEKDRDLRDPMPIELGTAVCADCHTPGSPPPRDFLSGARLKDRGRFEDFLVELNAAARMRSDQLALPFEHRVHISAEATPAKCLECHAGIPASTQLDLDAQQIATGACTSCHVAENGPLGFGFAEKRAPSVSAATFAHSDHLQRTSATKLGLICPEPSRARIQDEACFACHERNGAAAEYTVRREVRGYDGCIQCHDLSAWKTRDHGDWKSCVACHDFRRGDMAENRPTAQVERAPIGALVFEIGPQRHPGIIGERQAECAECHLAPVAELPSRTTSVAFDHATHLPSKPTPEHCDRCHATKVNAARSSFEIGTTFDGKPITAQSMPAQYGRTYDPTACVVCHPGLKTSSGPPSELRREGVLEFPHAIHLARAPGPDGDRVTCSTCHKPDPDDRSRIVDTLAAAKTCIMCHQHTTVADVPLYKHTGDRRGDEVTSCKKCHTSGVPEVQAAIDLMRRQVASVVGTQVHPAGQACKKCHLPTDRTTFQNPSVFDPVTGRKEENEPMMGKVRLSDVHGEDGPPDRNRVNCMGCHWNGPQDGFHPTEVSASARDVRVGDVVFGNDLGSYPGKTARKTPLKQ